MALTTPDAPATLRLTFRVVNIMNPYEYDGAGILVCIYSLSQLQSKITFLVPCTMRSHFLAPSFALQHLSQTFSSTFGCKFRSGLFNIYLSILFYTNESSLIGRVFSYMLLCI